MADEVVRVERMQPANPEPSNELAANRYRPGSSGPSAPDPNSGPVEPDGDVPATFDERMLYEVDLKRVARIPSLGLMFRPEHFHQMTGDLAGMIREDIARARVLGLNPPDENPQEE